MSIVGQLITDYTLLGSESKRKYPNVRKACDRSLEILKTVPNTDSGATSLADHKELVDPIIVACHSKSARLITIALSSLQKLAYFKGISSSRLPEVVAALQDATHNTPEIQVKILQILPTLFEMYSMDINDKLLVNLLFVCTSMQSSTKTSAVTNTAQATFSQLLNTVFEKVKEESRSVDAGEIKEPASCKVPIDDGKTLLTYPCAYDAQRVFNDLCTLIEHHKPSFLKSNYMTDDDGFETVESIIKNNSDVFLDHIELSYILRIRLAPLLLRFVSSCNDFTLMVRVCRLVYLLISEEMTVTKIESEVALSLLTHLISKDSDTPLWKRIFCLEIYSSLFKDFRLVEQIFSEYDNNQEEERRTVLKDFITTCNQVIDESRQSLNAGDIIQPPPSQLYTTEDHSATASPRKPNGSARVKQPQVFSLKESSVKQRYMDAIDKPDPPAVPTTYIENLVMECMVSLADGICLQSLELASAQSREVGALPNANVISFLDETSFRGPTDHEHLVEYTCVHDMVSDTWQDILPIYKVFLHSTVDDDTFVLITRSLQKLCHASGILSVREAQASILQFFAISTVELTGKVGYQLKSFSIGESIVGTISSTIGQAVSNMSHQRKVSESNAGVDKSNSKLYVRNLTSRNTTCFRVLINLALSLGEIIDDDWSEVLEVLQWISYFVDGPTDLNTRDIPPISPYLTNNDLEVISSALDKFTSGLKLQSQEVFLDICHSLVGLSNDVLPLTFTGHEKGSVPVENGKLQPCIFNRSFYVSKLAEICEVDPLKLLILRDGGWECVNSFYTKLTADRSLPDGIRLMSSRAFDSIMRATASAGFDSNVADDDEKRSKIFAATEIKVLTSLNNYLGALSKLPLTDELLVLNVEIQMALQTLNTLKSVIDRFGNHIKNEWPVVTSMLDLPFTVIKRAGPQMLQEKSIREMAISVLRSSFETLRVILDEVLQGIPSDQIRTIIDCLYSFVTQKYDLNISFNASSYFWLISDYLKEKIELSNPTTHSLDNLENLITDEAALADIVNSKSTESELDYYRCLWLYLVLKLAKTTGDKRAQVRNGSIITFFNVIESLTSSDLSWLLIYRIVLEPIIFQITPPDSVYSADKAAKKEWIEALINVDNGLTKLFTEYLSDFSDDSVIVFWHGFIEYLSRIVNLDPNWVTLTVKIFDNINAVTARFVNQSIPHEVAQDLYEFWVNSQITYNLSEESDCEDSILSFARGFSNLFQLVRPALEVEMLGKMLSQLQTCIRFPVLVVNRNDDVRCTKLQQQVISDIEHLSFEDPKFNRLLIQELVAIVTLPFSTHDIINEKLGGKGVKIPTFKAASYKGLVLLKANIATIDDISLYMENNGLFNVFDSLLEPCNMKSEQRAVTGDGRSLASESLKVLTDLSCRMCDQIVSGEQMAADDRAALWTRLLEVFNSCFAPSAIDTEELESSDLEAYRVLRDKLIYVLESSSHVPSEETDFVQTIWKVSFLYALTPLDEEILLDITEHADTSAILSKSFGSTVLPQPVPRIQIAKQCLQDLSTLSTDLKSDTVLDYFISRIAFTLNKYVSDSKLVHKRPVPRIQREEVSIVLNGLDTFLKCSKTNAESRRKLTSLYPLLVSLRSLPSDVKEHVSLVLLELAI